MQKDIPLKRFWKPSVCSPILHFQKKEGVYLSKMDRSRGVTGRVNTILSHLLEVQAERTDSRFQKHFRGISIWIC